MRGDFLLNAVKRAGQQQITRNRTDQECQNRGDDRRHQTFDKTGDDLEHQKETIAPTTTVIAV